MSDGSAATRARAASTRAVRALAAGITSYCCSSPRSGHDGLSTSDDLARRPSPRAFLDPGFLLLLVIALLFLWAVVARTAPCVLYTQLVKPAPGEAFRTRRPRPPRFARGVESSSWASASYCTCSSAVGCRSRRSAFVAAFLSTALGCARLPAVPAPAVRSRGARAPRRRLTRAQSSRSGSPAIRLTARRPMAGAADTEAPMTV